MGNDEVGEAVSKGYADELIDPKIAEHKVRIVRTHGDMQCRLQSPHSRAIQQSLRSGWRKTLGTAAIHIGFHWPTPKMVGGVIARSSSTGVPRSSPFLPANGKRNSIIA